MNQYLRFYSVIIGSELLNGRRKDSHFEFINAELNRRNLNHIASFTVVDNPDFLEDIFNFIKKDARSVMFSFGGIGATPDDYTRFVAAKVFSGGMIETHRVAKALIEARFGEAAYPNRIKMAELPIDADLIENPINQVPGFYLQDRFFFTPGFPEMSRPMVVDMLDKFFGSATKPHLLEVEVETSEEHFITFLETLKDNEVEFSSLPAYKEGKPNVVLAFKSYDKGLLDKISSDLINLIRERNFKHYILQGV